MNKDIEKPPWRDGEVIDDQYKVIRLAGEGGMGWVYQVRHLQWGIDLAVKRPKLKTLSAEDFEEEAEAWVSLGLHPNLCCCHYVRQMGGLPTVFAEYVSGGSLHDWIADKRLYEGPDADVLRRVLDVAIQFAWGLNHAHQRGMVHQDVKPRNVLLDTSDGDISVKVTDFGLARAGTGLASPTLGADAGEAASIRVSRAGLTTAYASPEQMRRMVLSQRTDVYSYAVSVLEMFTGKLLWTEGNKAGQALSDYLARGAAEPGMPPMPPALGALLQRCLLEEPEDPRPKDPRRPKSMAGVAAEIAAIYQSTVGSEYPRTMPCAADFLADELNNRAVSLLDLGRIAEAEKTFAAAQEADPRHLEATYNHGLRQWRSGTITDDVLISRLEAARTASADFWLARYLLAEVHLERGDHAAADELLRTVEHMASKEPRLANALQTSRSGQLADACSVKTLLMSWHEYDGPGIPRIDIRLTGNGQRALVLSGRHLGLWDTSSGRCLARLGANQSPDAHIDISAGGRFFLWGGGTVVGLWDLVGDRGMWRASTGAGSDAEITAVSLSADASIAATVSSTVVASSDKNNVMIWNARTGRLLLRLGKHSGVMPVALSSDGRCVLTSGLGDRTARLWDTGTGACVHELDVRGLLQGDQLVSAMSVSAGAKTAAIAREGIGIWDLDTGDQIRTLTGHTRLVRSLSWSKDARFLLSVADDDTVRLWEADSGRCLRTFPSTRSWMWSTTAVLLASDTGNPVVAEADTLRSWPLPRRYSAPYQLSRPRRHAELTRLDADAASLLDAAEQAIAAHQYSEAHRLLTEAKAIPGYERAPRVLSAWRSLANVLPRVGVRASWQVREFDTQYQGRAVDLSPDGTRAASGQLYTLHVWDTGTGRCLQAIEHPSMVTAAQFSPDQRRVATAAFCGQLGVWSADTGACLMKITRQQNDRAHWTHFSADARWALSNTYASIRLWDLNSGQCVRTVTCDDRFGAAVSLSPDGSRAVTTSMDSNTIRVWNMGSGECLHTLAGHTARIGALSMSPEGDLAVSSDDQKTMRLWDLASGTCMHILRDLPDRLWSVRFVCDGRFVMSGSTEGTIQVWDPRTGRCLHTFGSGLTEITVAPTPDGLLALSHGGDVLLRLWEFDWELALDEAISLPNEG